MKNDIKSNSDSNKELYVENCCVHEFVLDEVIRYDIPVNEGFSNLRQEYVMIYKCLKCGETKSE